MKQRLAEAPVGRLATVGRDGKPHLVPITFVLDGDTLYFAVDAKPKRTSELQRLKNIAVNPAVSVLVDHYEDDWARLWWVRADGMARLASEPTEVARALALLTRRYPEYRRRQPDGPVVAIRIGHLSGWSAS